MNSKVVAIVGSYRKGGTIDRAVEAVLAGARERGATTNTIYLTDQHIEFCTNCRKCMQEPGIHRGKCTQQDNLEGILTEIESASAVVLGSSVNCYNVTALFRRFMERLVGSFYWPWGQNGPTPRTTLQPRRAVLVASSAMPGFLIPLATGAARALALTAQMLGAKTIGHLYIGLAAQQPNQSLSPRVLEQARRLGWRLA